jgi:hypothetical protein
MVIIYVLIDGVSHMKSTLLEQYYFFRRIYMGITLGPLTPKLLFAFCSFTDMLA